MKTLDIITPDQHHLLIDDAMAGNIEQARQSMQSKVHNFRHYLQPDDSALSIFSAYGLVDVRGY